MSEHVKNVHSVKEKKKIFPCDQCEVVFGANDDVVKHHAMRCDLPQVNEQNIKMFNVINDLKKNTATADILIAQYLTHLLYSTSLSPALSS